MIYCYALVKQLELMHPRFLLYVFIGPIIFGVVCSISPFMWVQLIGEITMVAYFFGMFSYHTYNCQVDINRIKIERDMFLGR